MALLVPVTICILTDRSDSVFVAALHSAQFAEEILVIDNNSHNDWQQLAVQHRFTCLSYGNQPITDFASVRNFALEHICTEWTLFLDSDEEIPKNSIQKVASCIASATHNGFWITRQDSFLGRTLTRGEGLMQLVRLVRTKKSKFTGTVHEVAQVQGSIGASEILILHTPHESVRSFVEAVAQYAIIAALSKSTGLVHTVLEMLIFPPGKFIWNYLIKSGWRDGWEGLIYAVVMSLHSLWVRVYRYEKLKNANHH